MNKIIIFLFLFPFILIAQNNFAAVDSNVVWEQVFNDSVVATDYLKHLNISISQENPAILVNDYTSGQSTYMDLIEDKSSLSAFFRQPVKFDYRVDFKEEKYRVTIRNITFKGISITLYGVTDDTDTYLDNSLIRNRDGELRKNKMSQRIQYQLNSVFTKIFTYKTPDGW
jgi:hypothetical protein